MAKLFENLQGGVVSDNPLSSGATTVNSTAFASLPVVSGDTMWITLDPEGANGAPEIVQVTAHTAAATSVTVVRAQQDTSARAHPQNTVWVHALTEADIDTFSKTDHTHTAVPDEIAFVNHAAGATVARPTGHEMVVWYGSVQPNNMVAPDIVIRTDEAY